MDTLTTPSEWLQFAHSNQKSETDRYEALLSATRALKPMELYSTDPDFLSLYIELLQLKTALHHPYEDIEACFKTLKSKRVGTFGSTLYLAWAEFQVLSGHPDAAKQILSTAITLRVEPVSQVRDALASLISSRHYSDKENASRLKSDDLPLARVRKPLALKLESLPIKCDKVEPDSDDVESKEKIVLKMDKVVEPRLVRELSKRPEFGKLPRRLGVGSRLGPPMRQSRSIDDTTTSIPSPPTSICKPMGLKIDNTPPPKSLELFATPSPDEQLFNMDNLTSVTMDLESSETISPLNTKTPMPKTAKPLSLESKDKTVDMTSKDKAVDMTSKDKTVIIVNGIHYKRIELIGRGGSSKVFKILSEDGHIYALKKVKLAGQDSTVIEGYLNEISLLKKLSNNERIIKLVDYEIVPKCHVLMVLEYGEIDLAHLLSKQQTLSLHFIKNYWEQMLQAVSAIHEQNIVHSDLKPANFLLVEGCLKLIDFGIAKTIPNDTTNIHRDHQTGTINYMAPEAITFIETDGQKEVKIGRASDVWSLGCILYQFLYGAPPFGNLTMVKKLQSITSTSFQIPFPDVAPEKRPLLDVLKGCLIRDPKRRISIDELLHYETKFMSKAVVKKLFLFALDRGLNGSNVDRIVDECFSLL